MRERAMDPVVQRARAGDSQAWAELHAAHQPNVLGLILRMTNDGDLAEDLAQETWIKVLVRLPSFRGDSVFGTWVHRIAVNTVLDAQRSRRARRPSDLRGHVDPPVVHPASGDPFLWQRLVEVMEELPTGKRTVLLLHDLLEHTDSDIARMLDCAPVTARTQLHRARRFMREAIEGKSWAAA